MIEPKIVLADLSDNASLAEGLFTFAALLNERQDGLEYGVRNEGIVGSDFVHLDVIPVLERANENFEFLARWGVNLQ